MSRHLLASAFSPGKKLAALLLSSLGAASLACQPPAAGAAPPPTRLDLARAAFPRAEVVFIGRVLSAREERDDNADPFPVTRITAIIEPLRLYKGSTEGYRIQHYQVAGMDCSGQGGPVVGRTYAYFGARHQGRPLFMAAWPLDEEKGRFMGESAPIVALLVQLAGERNRKK